LLRVLQEQEFEAVGSNRVMPINVRIIAATSVDLQRKVDAGLFRADLYYRLNVLSIRVPPLRERVADMEALCENILEQIEHRTGLAHRELAPDAINRLRQCVWRGNVRELHNTLEKVAMLSDNTHLTASDLDGIIPADNLRAEAAATSPDGVNSTYASAVEDFERKLINNAVAAAQGRVEVAAKNLGMARATLYRKMQALGSSSQY